MHAAYAPYARWLTPQGGPPCTVAALDAHAAGAGVRFRVTDARMPALDYERRIANSHIVPLREGSVHDVWNALAWLRFPRAKAALNALHVAEAEAPTGNGRNAWRDRATLVDESGLLVACNDASLLSHWSRCEWRAAFAQCAATRTARITACAIGHGLLQKLAAPYRSLTAHAMVLPLPADASIAAIDHAAARAIAAREFRVRPLPVAALPGWDCEGLGDALFDDARVFRPARKDFAQEGAA